MKKEKNINHLGTLLFDGYHELYQTEKKPVLEIDMHGRISSANPLMLKMLGKKPESIVGDYLTNVLEPLGGNSRSFHYKWRAIQSGRPETADFILSSKGDRKYRIRFKTICNDKPKNLEPTITFTCERIAPFGEDIIMNQGVSEANFI